MDYPPLPETIEGPAGTVAIVLLDTVPCESGGRNIGLWDSEVRTITVCRTLPVRHQWATLYHELAHLAIHDSGLAYLITDKVQEALRDAISTARMRERFG